MTSCFMYAGDELKRGQRIPALNGDYNFVHQYDGNLAIYKTKGAEMQWSSDTAGVETTHLKLEHNGDLILYNGCKHVWKFDQSQLHHPHGPPYVILMQDNGEIAFNDKDLNYLGSIGVGLSVHHGDFDHSKLPVGGVLPLGGSLFTHGRVSVVNFTETGDLEFSNSKEEVKKLGVKGGKFLSMQDDGNLVLYGDKPEPIYDFKTTGSTAKGAKAAMILNNGNIVLVDDESTTVENADEHTVQVAFDFAAAP